MTAAIAERAEPLEVQQAAWLAAGRGEREIRLASALRELELLRLWRDARAGSRSAARRIADREREFDELLALAQEFNDAIREDPDCDGYLRDADGEELTS